jgi:outer membrane protein assembly factor BamD
MNSWIKRLVLLAVCLGILPVWTPAPLIYRPGEGWSYEPVGGGKWVRNRAKDQLEAAQAAFEERNYRTAVKAARRTVKVWPLSDYAPEAQYLLARSYEELGQDERAFREYQKLLETYPKIESYQEVLTRQKEIANRFLNGQWFRLWGYIPIPPSMDKTTEMYEKLIASGPFSEVAPEAQMNIGLAREKQSNFPEAVKAYEKAADRYHDQQEVAAAALFKAGLAYQRQARRAEYDQSLASQAIATFTDFLVLYPDHERAEEAREIISELRTEQARGSFEIARYYEKRKQWEGALVYYNEVLLKDASSKYADQARHRIMELQKRATRQTARR